MTEKERILHVATSGPDTPESLYAPFILAIAAKKGVAETIKLGNMPNLSKFVRQAQEEGVVFIVCGQSTQLLGLNKGDSIEGCKFGGPITLNDPMLSSKSTLVL